MLEEDELPKEPVDGEEEEEEEEGGEGSEEKKEEKTSAKSLKFAEEGGEEEEEVEEGDEEAGKKGQQKSVEGSTKDSAIVFNQTCESTDLPGEEAASPENTLEDHAVASDGDVAATAATSEKSCILEAENDEEGLSCGGVPCDALRRKMVGVLVLSVISVLGSLIGICAFGMVASGNLFKDVMRACYVFVARYTTRGSARRVYHLS